MTQSFVDLLPIAVGTLTDNGNGANAIISDAAIPTDQAWDCVDDPVEFIEGALFFDDETLGFGNNSYVRIDAVAGAGWRFRFQRLSDVGATNIEHIDRVDVIWVRRRAGLGTGARLALSIGVAAGQHLNGGVGVGGALPTSYEIITTSYTINPVTGLAWTKEEFEDQTFECGPVRNQITGGNSFAHVTAMHIHVVYTTRDWTAVGPAAGSWGTNAAGAGGWVAVGMETGTWTPA